MTAADNTRRTHAAPDGIEFIEALWEVHQHYVPSPSLVAFFEGLTRKETLGARVAGTGRVIVPPQTYCEMTFLPTEALVPVGPGGTIRSFTIVQNRFGNAPPPPLYLVFVQFDGAGTASPGYLRGHEAEPGTELALIGARCRAVFTPQPQGDWRDFWFELET